MYQSAYPQLQALAPQPPQQHLPQLPPGWELLYDPAGRIYYGCPSKWHVQWKFPYEHVQAAPAPALGSSASTLVTKPLAEAVSVSMPVQRDVEEVDAMDSRGLWYQAFIVKQDEKEALVHFSGWGKDTAEKIPLSDFAKRVRARSASTATGQLPIPSRAEVRQMFGVSPVATTPGALPPGWEVLHDTNGNAYYGNREMKKVQYEHPSLGVSSGKHSMAAQHSWVGAVNQVMSLRLRGKQIAPETKDQLAGGMNNNNFIQRLKMWGTLLSELFKVAMACLLSVFVPQNCPPSVQFDKEVHQS